LGIRSCSWAPVPQVIESIRLFLRFYEGVQILHQFNESALNSRDDDLGSSGPVLLPDQPGPHPHLLVTASKDGSIYLIDRDHMGGFHADSDAHAFRP
jgi:hypothetical protein